MLAQKQYLSLLPKIKASLIWCRCKKKIASDQTIKATARSADDFKIIIGTYKDMLKKLFSILNSALHAIASNKVLLFSSVSFNF